MPGVQNKLIEKGAELVGLDDELALVKALVDISTDLGRLAAEMNTPAELVAVIEKVAEGLDEAAVKAAFDKVGLSSAHATLKRLTGKVKDLPEKYKLLLKPLADFDSEQDENKKPGAVEWVLAGNKKAKLGTKVTLGVSGEAKLSFAANAKAKIGETETDKLLKLATDLEVKAEAGAELPVRWGTVGAELEASVNVGLDYYYKPANRGRLYGIEILDHILSLPDPFDYGSIWNAFQDDEFAGIVYSFTDKATARVNVALGVSGSLGDKVIAEAKLSLGASATTDNHVELSLRGLDRKGEIRPFEIILIRGGTREVGITAEIGVKVDFDASVARLREVLNKAIAKSDDVLGKITPYLSPGTWLRERAGKELDAAVKKLIDDPALAGLTEALKDDMKQVIGAPKPEGSALVAWLRDKLTAAIDSGAKDLTLRGDAAREQIIAKVVAALPGGLGEAAGAALREKTKDLIGPLVGDAVKAFEEKVDELLALPKNAFGKALVEAQAAVSKEVDRFDQAVEPIRKLVDQYKELLEKVRTIANDTARTRIAANVTLEESWNWGEEEKIVGRFESEDAADLFEEITRGDIQKVKQRLLDNIKAKKGKKTEPKPKPTPGFVLLPGSRIKYSAGRTSKSNLALVLFGVGTNSNMVLKGDASLIVDIEGKVQVDSATNLKKRFQTAKESREVSFVDTYSLRLAEEAEALPDDLRTVELSIGISHFDEQLRREELEDFVVSLARAGLVTGDTTAAALAKWDGWVKPGKSKITADIIVKLDLSGAQLRSLMEITARRAAANHKLSTDSKKRILETALQASFDAGVQKPGPLNVAVIRISDSIGVAAKPVPEFLLARLGTSGRLERDASGHERTIDATLSRMEAMVGLIEKMGDVYLATPEIDNNSPADAWDVMKFAEAQAEMGSCSSRWLQTGGGLFAIADGVSGTAVAFLVTICDLLHVPRAKTDDPIPMGPDILSLKLVHRDKAKVLEEVPMTQIAPVIT